MLRPSLILAATIAPASLLLAQSSEPQPSTSLPAVVVTAPAERETGTLTPSITEVPITPAEAATQVRQYEDLAARVPNLGITSNSQRSFNDVYSLRGIANTTFFSDPVLATYVDDVPTGDAFALFTPFYNLNRIEVFRGPQPTRFGLNGEAGAIDIHTHRADPLAWHGTAAASWGSYDSQEYRFNLGGPLIKEKLTLEISGFWSLSTGFVDNTFLANRRDDRDALGGRAVLTWTPAPDWDITLGFETARVNDGSQRIVRLDGDPFQVRSDVEGHLNIHQHREWLNIGKRFDTWQVRSITSHSEWEVDPALLDIDLSPARADFEGIFPGILPFPFGGTSEIRREQEIWSQELRFESLPPPELQNLAKDKDASGKDVKKLVLPVVRENHFRWSGGLFFQRKETSGHDTRAFSAPFVTFDPFFGLPLTVYTPLRQRTVFSQDQEIWAGYANVGYTWGRLDADIGARVQYDRKDFRRAKFDPVSLPAPARTSGSYEQVSFAPTLGLNYRVNENVDLFARTTYSFKPGGFSAFTDNPDLFRYDREHVWSSEGGIRVRGWDNRLRAQVTGFYSYIDNYQVERTFTFTDYLVLNAGHAKPRGVELELAVEPIQGLTFSGSIGYNETELHSFKDPVTFQNLEGNEAPYVPNFNALAAVEYRHSSGVNAKPSTSSRARRTSQIRTTRGIGRRPLGC